MVLGIPFEFEPNSMRRVPTAINMKGEDPDMADRKRAVRSRRVNGGLEALVVVE